VNVAGETAGKDSVFFGAESNGCKDYISWHIDIRFKKTTNKLQYTL